MIFELWKIWNYIWRDGGKIEKCRREVKGELKVIVIFFGLKDFVVY